MYLVECEDEDGYLCECEDEWFKFLYTTSKKMGKSR
jgi:hypothetical protein